MRVRRPEPRPETNAGTLRERGGESRYTTVRESHTGELLSVEVEVFDDVFAGRKVLVKQHRLQVLPGWNTRMLNTCNIVALSHGRAMLTTEKVQPKLAAYEKLPSRLGEVLPQHLVSENIYRVHVHVIPDEQHQYFKLVDQV